MYQPHRLSPDGTLFAFILSGGVIRLVDLRTDEEHLLRAHPSKTDVRALAFSHDGQMLASGDTNGSVILWNVKTRQPILERAAHAVPVPEPVYDLAFSPDGTLLASASRDRTAKLWQVATGSLLETFQVDKHTDTRSSVYSVAFSPDSNLLATGTSGDNVVILWDVASRQLVQKLRGHQHDVTRLAFSADGTVLASAGSTIMLWNVGSGDLRDSLPTNIDGLEMSFLAFAPDSSVLAAVDRVGVKLWQLGNYPPNPRVIRIPDDWNSNVAVISPDGSTGVIGTTSGRIGVWDISSGTQIREFSHGASVTCVAWDDDHRQVLSTGLNEKVRLWNADTGELLRTFEHESKQANFEWGAFSPRGGIVAASRDLSVSKWDLGVANPERKELRPRSSDQLSRRYYELSPDGRLLATVVYTMDITSSLKNRHLMLWDTVAKKSIHTVPECFAGIPFSPDGSILAYTGQMFPSVAVLWDVVRGKELKRLETGRPVCFSSDGKRLLCTHNGRVSIWDIGTATLQFELDAHPDNVGRIFMTPNSRTLSTVGDDYKIKQWRAATDEEVQEMRQRWRETAPNGD